MDERSRQDHETQELIRRFEAARARKRRARLLVSAIGALVVLAAVVGGTLALAHENPSHETPSGTVTTHHSSPQSTTTSLAATTSVTPLPSTKAPMTTSDTVASAPPASATGTVASTASTAGPVPGKVVVIDPGHQARGNPGLEPVGPGSQNTKAKVTDGTSGTATGIPESELVLAVSLKLRDALDAAGVQVVMTRTAEDVDLSNIQRAEIANQAEADLFVRIHADGSNNSATTGIHVLYPASIDGWTDDIAVTSKRAASLAQQELIAATRVKDRGIDARDDMTGFNWSDVPVILPEIGFMTNPAEDRLLATAAYRDTIASALSRAILEFLEGM